MSGNTRLQGKYNKLTQNTPIDGDARFSHWGVRDVTAGSTALGTQTVRRH